MRRLFGGIAVACALACGGEQITRYTGSAMNDAVPDSAGSLRLAFFSHTDTSFSGIMELGAPLSGGGSVYAWHDGAELKLVSVGAVGGDTIVWHSGNTGDNIGGRFDITRGPHAGQGGTWRARLASGPPVSTGTMKQPMSFPYPPFTSLWPLLVVGITIGAAVQWIRRAPTTARATADKGAPPFRPGQSLSGISGWLALFLFFQCVALLVAIVRVTRLPAFLIGGFRVGPIIITMEPLLVLEAAVQLVVIPVSIALGIILIVRRDRRAPRFWFAYIALSAVYLAIDHIAGQYLDTQIMRLVGTVRLNTGAAATTTPSALSQILVRSLWALYWAHSLRVRATFGAAALDTPAPSPDPLAGPAIAAGVLPAAGGPAT